MNQKIEQKNYHIFLGSVKLNNILSWFLDRYGCWIRSPQFSI